MGKHNGFGWWHKLIFFTRTSGNVGHSNTYSYSWIYQKTVKNINTVTDQKMWNLKFLKIKLLVTWMCSRIPIITIFHYINIHRFRSLNILMFTGSEVWFRQNIQSTLDISNPEGTGQTVRDTQSFSDNLYLHISIDILWIINKIIIRLKARA